MGKGEDLGGLPGVKGLLVLVSDSVVEEGVSLSWVRVVGLEEEVREELRRQHRRMLCKLA